MSNKRNRDKKSGQPERRPCAVDPHPTTCNLCGGQVIYTSNERVYGRKYGSEYSARDCAPQPLKLSIHSGGIEHPCRCR